MVWGMIGLGDRAKSTVRSGRKDSAQVVAVQPDTKTVTLEYDDGERVNVRIADTTKTRR